jgi:ABC-type Fe3+/spermidine/putrescine transport system ATPase subunit
MRTRRACSSPISSGQVNALPGRVTGYEDGRASVDVLGLRVTLRADRSPPPDVLVLVRPEAVHLSGVRDGAIVAVVEELDYRGDRIEYRIRVGDTTLVAIEAALGRRGRIAPGDRIGVELAEDALHLLPAGPSDPAEVSSLPAPPGRSFPPDTKL